MFSSCVRTEKLNRLHMEDFFFINKKKSFFCICDGHSGKISSLFVAYNFYTYLKKKISEYKNKKELNIKIFLYDLCKEIDLDLYKIITSKIVPLELLNNKKNIYISNILNQGINDNSGTTFSSVFIISKFLYFLNIGDSMTLLIKNDKIEYLNKIHKPENENEKKRILKTFPVINNRINGNINISRTFGDFSYKNLNKYYESSIIAKPNIHCIDINTLFNQNSWILIASDGIYVHYSINLIVKTVNYLLKCGFKKSIIADLILNHYKFINNNDNLTFIIILIDKIETNIFEQNYLNNLTLIHKKEILNNIKNNNFESKFFKEKYFYNYIINLNIENYLQLILLFLKDFILYDMLIKD